ncbi:MAG: hypothetical protein VW683_02670 [Betaproteobacteria bacterium]
MKTKKVTKLWKGRFVSVRDYEVASAIKSGGMEIKHYDQTMFLSPDDLRKIEPTGPKVKSKTGGKDYYLMDILFTPITEDINQLNLLDKE